MPAAEVRILDAIGSMPPDKSLTLLQLSGRSIHAAVSALTGPNASHTIKELEVRCLSAEDMNALWSLLSIPTLERFTVDGHPTDVLSGPQIVVVQDTLQTRMHEGLPPLQTVSLGSFFSAFCGPRPIVQWAAGDARDMAALLQWIRAVIESESPTTEFATWRWSVEELVESLLIIAHELERANMQA